MHVQLVKGSYSISDVKLFKVAGNVPVPLLTADRIDLAIQWRALFAGRLVGHIVMQRPQLNFVDDGDPNRSQTGAGGPWLQMIRDLFPFKIDSAQVRDGRIAFRAFDTKPPVDVYLSKVQGSVTNLTNVQDATTPLFAALHAEGIAMDQANIELDAMLDPFSYHPTFDLRAKVVALDVTKLNALARAYGSIDFEHGWFDCFVEAHTKQGLLDGYVKPIFRNLRVFSLSKDARIDLIGTFWEALVGIVGAVLKNQFFDQLATVIPMHGELGGVDADIFATIASLLRNAFARALLPQFATPRSDGPAWLEFGPGSIPTPKADK
ncbi:MAG: DUF748 domain-containing protein [Planctomycetota bacterium]